MNFFRKHILSRLFAFFCALHILNISVDTPDVQMEHFAEDLSVNDMESISEIICEKLFGIENAFREHDEHDNNDNGSPLTSHFSLLFFHQPALQVVFTQPSSLMRTKDGNELFSQFFPSSFSPPPEA